jgi:hypothetical protein
LPDNRHHEGEIAFGRDWRWGQIPFGGDAIDPMISAQSAAGELALPGLSGAEPVLGT